MCVFAFIIPHFVCCSYVPTHTRTHINMQTPCHQLCSILPLFALSIFCLFLVYLPQLNKQLGAAFQLTQLLSFLLSVIFLKTKQKRLLLISSPVFLTNQGKKFTNFNHSQSGQIMNIIRFSTLQTFKTQLRAFSHVLFAKKNKHFCI